MEVALELQVGAGAFHRPYGAPLTDDGDTSTNFTHQEAIYNAGVWGDLMQNFVLKVDPVRCMRTTSAMYASDR